MFELQTTTSSSPDPRTTLVSELGLTLLKTNALKIGSFETTDGKLTPYFIDLRKIPSIPSALSTATRCLEYAYAERSKSFDSEYVCGIPIPGLILSSILASDRELPLIYPSRLHPNSVIGLLKPGAGVVVIDDVSETGLSIKAAIQAVRASGGVVNHALTLIDRGEGADKILSEVSVMLHHFTTIDELASTLRKNMALSDEQIEALEGANTK